MNELLEEAIENCNNINNLFWGGHVFETQLRLLERILVGPLEFSKSKEPAERRIPKISISLDEQISILRSNTHQFINECCVSEGGLKCSVVNRLVETKETPHFTATFFDEYYWPVGELLLRISPVSQLLMLKLFKGRAYSGKEIVPLIHQTNALIPLISHVNTHYSFLPVEIWSEILYLFSKIKYI